MLILQRFRKRGFVNQTATGAVDDTDTALCFLQTRAIKNVARLSGERRMQRYEIGARKQIVQLVHQLHLQTPSARHGKIRIVRDDAHPESNGAPAQLAANPAHADNAECLVVTLDTLE